MKAEVILSEGQIFRFTPPKTKQWSRRKRFYYSYNNPKELSMFFNHSKIGWNIRAAENENPSHRFFEPFELITVEKLNGWFATLQFKIRDPASYRTYYRLRFQQTVIETLVYYGVFTLLTESEIQGIEYGII